MMCGADASQAEGFVAEQSDAYGFGLCGLSFVRLMGTYINGYLVLQGNIHLRTEQFQHFLTNSRFIQTPDWKFPKSSLGKQPYLDRNTVGEISISQGWPKEQNMAAELTVPGHVRDVYIRERGRVLLTEILLPRIARQGTVCLISVRG